MGFSALQIILVFVWVFIVAIDQFDFLESLYQPIVSGAVIGDVYKRQSATFMLVSRWILVKPARAYW